MSAIAPVMAGPPTYNRPMAQLVPAERLVISVEEYAALLWRLVDSARLLNPLPDSVVGVKRSGLFPAVFLSHQLELPLFTGSEAKSFPFPRLRLPLLTDTTAWTGESLRRIAARLTKSGALPRVLVMFARADPLPPVDRLNYLETTMRIPRFWYEKPESIRRAGQAAVPGDEEEL